ncbi:MAG: hypothetical protein AB8B62_19900 [Roseobacter sp.]
MAKLSVITELLKRLRPFAGLASDNRQGGWAKADFDARRRISIANDKTVGQLKLGESCYARCMDTAG